MSALDSSAGQVDPRARFRGVGAEAAVAAFVAAASQSDPQNVLLATVAPLLTRGAVLAREEWRAEGERVREMALSAAEAREGALDAIAEVAARGDSERGLLVDAVNAAASSRYPPSVRAVGRALSAGLLDDGTSLDHEQQLIEALGAVGRAHVMVMWRLRSDSDVPPEEGKTAGWFVLQMTTRELRDKLPQSYAASLDRLLATLEREGVVGRVASPAPTYADISPTVEVRDLDREQVGLTDFGLAVLRRLWEVGADETIEVSDG